MNKQYKLRLLSLLGCIIILFASITGCFNVSYQDEGFATINDVPEFDGETPYVVINANIPDFLESELVTSSYEKYSYLDFLGRCGTAMACVGVDIMPTEERGSIGQVKPSGWQTVKYNFIDGKYLYNRCHLIAYQLTGENANDQNLITGTRFMNTEGMLPFEEMIAEYVKETGNHVIYRVTPYFEGLNLLASGVQMEAMSVEDNGEGICFNVYAYNAQPGILIDYLDGKSELVYTETNIDNTVPDGVKYVLNTNSKKIHLPTCEGAADIKDINKEFSNESKSSLLSQGYEVCKNCNP